MNEPPVLLCYRTRTRPPTVEPEFSHTLLSLLHTHSLHIFRVVSVVEEQLGQALKAVPLFIQVHLRLPHHVHQDRVAHLVQQHLLG